MAIYDTIGATYTTTRRPDPRIAAQIHAALADVEAALAAWAVRCRHDDTLDAWLRRG
jgi:hypothetical protein